MKKYILLCVATIVISAGFFFARDLSLFSTNISATPIATASTSSTATLLVEDARYEMPIKNGASILDVMRAFASSTSFRFSSRQFPVIGVFVESINGKKNANGKYWILYVNGTQSPKGVSQSFVFDGDKIEWRYEKGS